ncbi:Trans-enoyl reductase lepG [Paramyrothecium foliicola]|nr:Trans-enoyl reductase lepG [Paramyrothecium foliicola]
MPSFSYPETHPAVVTPGKRLPLEIRHVPTVSPGPGEVVVHVKWTASSPLELHQADGGLLTTPDFILGANFAGEVVALGPEDPTIAKPDATPLALGDTVVSFTPPDQKQAGFQTYVTVPSYLMGRVPANIPAKAAVTVPTNLVTAFHTITHDLGLELPWPIPAEWRSKNYQDPILVWGAASSVGLFSIQVLRHWGYKDIIAVASSKHHDELRKLGATACFDYRHENVTDEINAHRAFIPHIIDCIGHVEGTLRPLSRIAKPGSTVAIMMPAIIKDATDKEEPILSMEPKKLLPGQWNDDVNLIGVRTFFYAENEFFKTHLQQDIIPALLESGAIQPNKQRIVEGPTLLERAQKAMVLLRERAPSGERLVWRVAEE